MKKAGLILTAAALTAASLGGYNACIETEELTICSSRLPEAFDGFRAALVSDVHGRFFGREQEVLLRRLRAAKPDLIALCGDLVDSREQIPAAARLAEQLCALAPTYYVTGNHEWGAKCVNEVERALTEAGVRCLRDRYELIARGGAFIAVAGVDDPKGEPDPFARRKLAERIHSALPEGYTLMLSHPNEAPEAWLPYDVQTVLSGHGHGGVIRLPGVGGLVNNERRMPARYEQGLYYAGGTTVAVSRGLGGIRVLSRTHLPIVVLKRAES